MGMVMIRCPNSGHAIPTGIRTDRARFQSSPVFYHSTDCARCGTTHLWFAREAWLDEQPEAARESIMTS